jgi:hypothetical protein
MGSLAVEYCEQLKRHFKKFHATFPPNEPLKLGDFGVLHDDVFERLGNVRSRFGVDFAERLGLATAPLIDFSSKGSVEIEFTAAGGTTGGGVPIKAGIELKFSRSDAVFFNAAACTFDSIEDQVELGERILKLYDDGRWERKFVVVTSLMRAGATTIVVSSSSNSSITLEASTPGVAAIDLADASLKLSIKRLKDVALKIVTAGEITPLIGLSKIHGGIFSGDDFGPERLRLERAASAARPVREPSGFLAVE